MDVCVGRILDAIQRQGGVAIVTADHGNCEQMIDPATGGPHTAHTTYPVELIVVDDRFKGKTPRRGRPPGRRRPDAAAHDGTGEAGGDDGEVAVGK